LANLPILPPDQQAVLKTVLRLAQTCEYELEHTNQVTYLAVRLFDELQSLHHYNEKERSWLVYAALLHDIGWIEGWKNHHKVSLRIILTTPMVPFNNKERLIIGSVARYHHKSLPDLSHDHYSALLPAQRHLVDILAGCLRLADGLDHSHQQRITDLKCKITKKKILVACDAIHPVIEEYEASQARKNLLELALSRRVEIIGMDPAPA
jgi:exopolyphosphatase/guanosine-5'-triphosphate,3'-diphosphate pyrophosphatase